MAEESLKQSLQKYGFTPNEAEIYIFLSRSGPCPARLVARRFNINRMKAYRTLRSLEEKGLVESIMGRPIRFAATPLGEILERHLKEMKDRVNDLESVERSILDTWNNLSKENMSQVSEPRFRIFQGRQQIYDLLLQLTDRVRDEITILTTPRDLNRLSYMGFDDRLQELTEAGRRVHLLTQVESAWIEDIEYYQRFVDVRHVDLPSAIRVIIVDGRETITTVAMDDTMSMTTKDDTGLWTDSASFVIAMKVFFESLWNMAPPAENIIKSLKLGEDPQEIRVINTMGEYLSTFQSMIERSQTQIDIMVRRINDLPLSLIDLVAVLERDVKIRLLTQIELENFPEIKQIPQSINLKHNPSETGLLLLIVDDSKTILNIPHWEDMGQAVWSNLDSYVSTMIQVFEDYWKNGQPLKETMKLLTEIHDYDQTIYLIKSKIEESGWNVIKNGAMKGANNAQYPFSLVCTHLELENPIGIELVLGDDLFSNIIRIGTYQLKLKDQYIIIATLHPNTEQEIDLAKIYNIILVDAVNSKELSQKLLEYTQNLFKH